jgi:hypothetical protein
MKRYSLKDYETILKERESTINILHHQIAEAKAANEIYRQQQAWMMTLAVAMERLGDALAHTISEIQRKR